MTSEICNENMPCMWSRATLLRRRVPSYVQRLPRRGQRDRVVRVFRLGADTRLQVDRPAPIVLAQGVVVSQVAAGRPEVEAFLAEGFPRGVADQVPRAVVGPEVVPEAVQAGVVDRSVSSVVGTT